MATQPSPILERETPLIEFRTEPSGDGLTLSGYAAVFNSPTRIDSWEGTFDETIARGAFKRSINARMPIVQWNHGNDPSVGAIPIASIESLREDAHGLHVVARLHDTPRVNEIRASIESGAVTGMSFRFQVVRESWDEAGDVPVRTLQEVRLFELGPVAFPAYQGTSVGVRTDDLPSSDSTAARLADEALESAPAVTDDPASNGNAQYLRFVAHITALRSAT